MEEDRQSMELLLEKARRAVRARTAGQDATRLHATTLDEDRANNKNNNNNNNSSIITTSGGSVSAPLNAKDNRVEFARHHHRLITSFVEDKTKFVLDLPNLTAFDRLVVHAVAEQSNLSHTSTGSGTQRVMRLTKDALFFEDPTAVHRVRLEELVEKVANKESRFQLRFHRAADPSQLNAGAIGSYADDEVANKVARLQRATDEYRRATNMGYSQDDLSAQEREGGRTIEEMLRQPNAEPEEMRAITSGEPTTSSSSRLAHDDHRPMRQIMPTGAMRYEEVCRGCGARAAVEGPLEKWSCAKYCAECTRQTIWALDGQPIAATTHNNNVAAPTTTTTTTTSSTAATKRPRDGANNNKEEVPSTTSLVEAIDLDDDAQLTVEDVVEMACLNDVSPHDTNWLRRCATQHRPQVERGVAFCVSYADLLDVSLFRRFDLKGMSATCRPIYVAVREVATPMTRITTLAEAALLTAKIDDEDDDDSTKKKKTKVEEMEGQTSLSNVLQRLMPHVGVALLNVSVYGSGATAILQLRPTRQPMSSSNSTPDELICFDEEALMKLQQRYGSRHFFVSRSLHDAVKHAEEEDA